LSGSEIRGCSDAHYSTRPGTIPAAPRCISGKQIRSEEVMGFGRGALLWLLGVPLPIVILLALFWHH
jgi:hypothetical protein